MSGDDFELLKSWRQGNRGAGNVLLGRYFDSLFRFFASKIDDEVEDLIQATLMACVKYQESFEAASSFKAYLFTVARHQLYRHLRKRARHEGVDFGSTSVVDLGTSPASAVARREQQRELLAALRQLPVELQTLLELHYWEDLSTAELATVLEIPQGTAKSRLRRARQLLSEALASPTSGVARTQDDLERWVRSVRLDRGSS